MEDFKDFEEFSFDFGDFSEFALVTETKKEKKEVPQLTDEQYLKRIRAKMNRFISNRVSGDAAFDNLDLRSMARKEIRKCLGIKEYYYYDDEDDLKDREDEVKAIFERLEPAINEIADEATFEGHRKRSIWIMNKSMAEAEITRHLESSGYDFYIHYTLHCAKVHIKITRLKKAILYIRYKDLKTKVPKILGTLETLKAVYADFGAGSGVVSLYGNDDETFDYARQDRQTLLALRASI